LQNSPIQLKHIEELELIDRSLMHFIVGAHSKTPSEFLYLETATIPLRYTIMIRRMLYFQTIVTRSEMELIRRVYNAQRDNPVKGDWVNILKEDFRYISEEVNEEDAKSISKFEYKKNIKNKIRQRVFEELKQVKDTHSKVRNIQYESFEIQEYMKNSVLTNQEISLLFSMRSKTMRSVKTNFGITAKCSLGCLTPENQEHGLVCQKTLANRNTNIEYSDMFGSFTQQISIVKLNSQLEEERTELCQRAALSSPVALISGP
jgi:hypothetical protein